MQRQEAPAITRTAKARKTSDSEVVEIADLLARILNRSVMSDLIESRRCISDNECGASLRDIIANTPCLNHPAEQAARTKGHQACIAAQEQIAEASDETLLAAIGLIVLMRECC